MNVDEIVDKILLYGALISVFVMVAAFTIAVFYEVTDSEDSVTDWEDIADGLSEKGGRIDYGPDDYAIFINAGTEVIAGEHGLKVCYTDGSYTFLPYENINWLKVNQ